MEVKYQLNEVEGCKGDVWKGGVECYTGSYVFSSDGGEVWGYPEKGKEEIQVDNT